MLYNVDLGWVFCKRKFGEMWRETLTEVMIARIRTENFHTALEAMLQTQGHEAHFPVFPFFHFII